MSGPDRLSEHAPSSSKSKPRANISEEDQKDIELLDADFERIKSSAPIAPYILSTPSLHPYSHYSRHESRAWMLGHLFEPHEEHLQYRTFLYREPYQDCFVLQPGEEVEPDIDRPKSQASDTPAQGTKKMKISLSAYKSKQANGVITPGSKKISPSLTPTKPSLTNGVKQPIKQTSSSQAHEGVKTNKRPAPDALVPEKLEKRIRDDQPLHQPPQKAESTDSKANPDRSAPSNATPHGLPPLLSPVDQPLGNPYGLPAILSPTLPSNVQAELDRLETNRKRGDSNASTSSSDRKSALLAVPLSRPPKSDEQSKSGPRIRSVSVSGKSPSKISLNRGDGSGPSLVVKLRYSKRLAPTIAQLLRLPPSRKAQLANEKKTRQGAPDDRPVKVQAKAVDGGSNKSKEAPKITARKLETPAGTTKAISTSTRAPEKRPRSEDDPPPNVPSKRPKSSQDGPTTPAQQIVSSPALSNKSSAQKSQGPYATPRKDHKAINMLRTTSTEGYDSTPGRSGATPGSAKLLDPRAALTTAPLSGKKQVDYQSLSQISQKLNQLGRSLKHEAQKVGKEDHKRAAATALECILSYMAAYSAQDQSNSLRGRPGDVEATWKTLLPLCNSYAGRTKQFPHLEGLRLYLSAVICAAICAHVAPRAPRPKAHDSPQDTPHPELAKQFSQLNENFSLLADHYMQLFRAAQEARITLPFEDIQKQYPKTWAAKEANAKLSKIPDRFLGGDLSGPYFLPVQSDTTPIQAVRFGLKFLGEFCEKEKLTYNIRVTLGKPE